MASQTDNESNAHLSKSLYRIDKTLRRLSRLDSSHFPTSSSEIARDFLSKTLKSLEENAPIDISPHALYQRLFDLQKLVGIIEQSSDSRISWPIVCNCDKIWQSFFGKDGPRIFYSLTDEYNYHLRSFSEDLKKNLTHLLAKDKIDSSIVEPPLYCLQLASSEDENLSFYAIIGHEFGHAIFTNNMLDLQVLHNECFFEIHNTLFLDILSLKDKDLHAILSEQVKRIIRSIAEELFCDLVGGLTMGPAFFLSSYEMSWGSNAKIWEINLFPDELSAYPSPSFRLSCLKKSIGVDTFCVALKKEIANALIKPLGETDLLYEIDACMSRVPVDHDSDDIYISFEPQNSSHETLIKEILKNHLKQLKESFQAFLDKSYYFLEKKYPDSIPTLDAKDIVQLLIRFEHKILPNIIPQKDSLLGLPASFTAILNASALYRYKVLTDKSQDKNLKDLTSLVDRLTTKAFEVSFMQDKYNQKDF